MKKTIFILSFLLVVLSSFVFAFTDDNYYYNFENDTLSGNIIEDISLGTQVNGTNFSTIHAVGIVGDGRDTSPASSYILIDDALSGSTWSVGFCFKRKATGDSGFIYTRDPDDIDIYFSTNDFTFYSTIGTGTPIKTIADTNWHSATVIYDGSRLWVWVDTVLEVNVSRGATAWAADDIVKISREGGNEFNGIIDEFWVINRAVTEAEMLSRQGSGTCTTPSEYITAVNPPTNSSWNVTSEVVSGESTIAWNTGGLINITEDNLSFTFTSDVNSNWSCRMDAEQNYTQMVAANANYKLATTDTTSHAGTLFDTITLGNHCLYCSGITSDGIETASGTSSSGCLNFTLVDIVGPTITAPANATLEFSTDALGVQFNATDDSGIDTFFIDNWCYQETANVSTACGGLNTGNYTCTGSWGGLPCENVFDGDWGTRGYSAGPNEGFLEIFYIKPIGALPSSIWTGKDEGGLFNLSIPLSCWNYNPNYIRFNVTSSSLLTDTYWDCWNGTWARLRTDTSSAPWEEAMRWNLNSSGNFTINSSGYLINTTNLAVSVYTINVRVNDTLGNINSTIYGVTVQDTIIPNIVSPANVTLEFSVDTLLVKFNATDLSGIDTFTVNHTSNFTINSSGHLINATNLAIDTYILNITVNDTQGNINSTIYKVTVRDSVFPLIDFAGGTASDNVTVRRDWIYINTSVTELNFKNITFYLYNSSGLVSSNTKVVETFNHNFTSIFINVLFNESKDFYYNVTICDTSSNCNSTGTRQINLQPAYLDFNVTNTTGTLDFYPTQSIQTEVEAWGQTSTVGAITLDNNLTNTIDVYVKLNETNARITLKLGNTSTYSNSITINTSYQRILNNLNTTTNQYIWAWADYNAPTVKWYPKLEIVGLKV